MNQKRAPKNPNEWLCCPTSHPEPGLKAIHFAHFWVFPTHLILLILCQLITFSSFTDLSVLNYFRFGYFIFLSNLNEKLTFGYKIDTKSILEGE